MDSVIWGSRCHPMVDVPCKVNIGSSQDTTIVIKKVNIHIFKDQIKQKAMNEKRWNRQDI